MHHSENTAIAKFQKKSAQRSVGDSPDVREEEEDGSGVRTTATAYTATTKAGSHGDADAQSVQGFVSCIF